MAVTLYNPHTGQATKVQDADEPDFIDQGYLREAPQLRPSLQANDVILLHPRTGQKTYVNKGDKKKFLERGYLEVSAVENDHKD